MGVEVAVMASLAAASAANSFKQQRNMAKAQQAQQKRNNERATADMIDQYGQMSDSERQSQEQTISDSMEVQKEAQRRKAELNLSAASTGIGGNSVLGMFNSINRDTGSNFNTIFKNREIEQSNFRNKATSIRTGTVANYDTRIIEKPSYLQGAIQVGTATAQGYMQGAAHEKAMKAK